MRIHFKRIKDLGARARFVLLAIMLAVTTVLGNVLSNPVHAAIGTVTEYAVPTPGTSVYPLYVTVGPDNNIWYTGDGGSASYAGKLTTSGTVNLTQYLPSPRTYGSHPTGITKGSDGNLWYAEQNASGGAGQIIKMTTAGAVLGQYTIPNGYFARNMTLGSDGLVWFTVNGNVIGKITASGTITEYSVPATGGVYGITVGPDGNLWYTAANTGSSYSAIGKITTSGVATTYPIPTSNASAYGIVNGPDGNLWFTEANSNKIGKITTSGVVAEYSTIPTTNSRPYGITAGSDGALWFVEYNSGKVGRITTSGSVTEYTAAGTTNHLDQITTGPDGAVWFTTAGLGKIMRMATELTNQTLSFTSTAPANAVIDGATYTPVASATSGLPVVITVDSSSSSVCSIQSGVVSFQQAGTCTLNANQAGNADYNPAPQVQQSFTVAPVNGDTSVGLSCPSTALVGATVTCTITIANNGPAAAQNTSLTALFPSSLTSPTLSGGGTISGQYITWSTPSLASGASTTLTFSATASVAGKMRINAALLQTSPDPDSTNNIVDSTIKIS